MTRRPGSYASEGAFRRALEDRLKARASERGEDLARLRRLVAFDPVGPPKTIQGPPERGCRFGIQVGLAGRPFTSFHLDVGLGDPEPEPPDWITSEDFLSFAGIPAPRIALVPVAQ